MASIKTGRDYISSYERVVEMLISCLIQNGNDGFFGGESPQNNLDNLMTINMIIATLQKLSLKCFIRKKLIEKGIVEWLVKYLEQLNPNWSNQSLNENNLFNADSMTNYKDQASCYGLEYSTALFMNLCLHKSGKEKCLPMAKL